jgi:ubiquinone/menaquinone biosynthesis C-methylase UbiE
VNPVLAEKRLYDKLASEDGDSSLNYYRHAGPDLRLKALARAVAGLKAQRVLEVGCSDGHVLKSISERSGPLQASNFSGIDLSLVSLRRAKTKGFSQLVQSDALELPFRGGAFDLLIASQVLEHLSDHRGALKQAYSALKAGGHLILTVPMADWFKLYKGLVADSSVKFLDEETHQREWSLIPFQKFVAVNMLIKEIKSAGFKVIKSNGIFYGSWRLEKICDWLLLNRPALFRAAEFGDRFWGMLPGFRWTARYAIITAIKK